MFAHPSRHNLRNHSNEKEKKMRVRDAMALRVGGITSECALIANNVAYNIFGHEHKLGHSHDDAPECT